MPTPVAPRGLAAAGRKLWKDIASSHDLDAVQLVQLTEACRAKDRLDELDALLRGEGVLVIDKALDKANATANLLKQLLAALRLPDTETGVKPQRRGARGAYRPTARTAGSAKDRLRAV